MLFFLIVHYAPAGMSRRGFFHPDIMQDLHIDIETFSSYDLRKDRCGVHVYAESPDFEILMVAYSIDGGPVKSFCPVKGEPYPREFLTAYNDPDVLKWAHNAAFERTCFAALGMARPATEWRCTMVLAYHCGLPGSLKVLSGVLKLGAAAKDTAGTALINKFCKPCKPAKTHGLRTRHHWYHFEDDWNAFVAYCEQDVVAEMAVHARLGKHEITDEEWAFYAQDQRINDAGVPINTDLAETALALRAEQNKMLTAELREITGIQATGNVSKLGAFVAERIGEPVDNFTKDYLAELLGRIIDPAARRVIELRLMLSKISVKKYLSMLKSVNADERARGALQFYGASRTGRWAGRRIQFQNIPRNYLSDLDGARNLVLRGDLKALSAEYPEINDTLSQLIRTALEAPQGRTFVVVDYSAIEARVLAWLAKESWRLEVFRTHGKIYEASAAAVFGVPLESVTKDSPLRQQGKVRELACGYGGSVGAMRTMDYGNILPEDDAEVKAEVDKWRAASPNVVRMWRELERASKQAVENPGRRLKDERTGLVFLRDADALWITLPSGRKLAYWGAHLGEGRFGEELRYFGMDERNKWVVQNTYGGKLTENIDQAISRDLLADAMFRVEATLAASEFICFHVHDEIVIECDERDADNIYETVNAVMSAPPSWAEGLPLAGDGFISVYYKK